MATSVARTRARRKPAKVAAGPRRARQRQVRDLILQAIVQTVKAVVEAALDLEVTELLGRERYARRSSAGHGTIRAKCSRCGSNWPAHFWRGGSYRRTLLVLSAAEGYPRPSRCGCRG